METTEDLRESVLLTRDDVIDEIIYTEAEEILPENIRYMLKRGFSGYNTYSDTDLIKQYESHFPYHKLTIIEE